MSRAMKIRSLKNKAYFAQKDLHKYAVACVATGILYPPLAERSMNPFTNEDNNGKPSYVRRLVVDTLNDWYSFFRTLQDQDLVVRHSVPMLLGGPIEEQLALYTSGVISAAVRWFQFRDQLHSTGVLHAYTYLIERMAWNHAERRALQDYVSDGTPHGVWRE